MLIFFDYRIPEPAKKKLSEMGTAFPFKTTGIVYDSIAGHPDIFFCKSSNSLIVAPNTPENYLNLLTEYSVEFKIGHSVIGNRYPESARYNALISDNYIIHRSDITDDTICQENSSLKRINVSQGYTRCSSFFIGDTVVTSDFGVEKKLSEKGLNSILIDPHDIILPGQKHGLIGGCCGMYGNTIVFTGNIDILKNGDIIRSLAKKKGYSVTELYNGPLFDGGTVLFLPCGSD